MISLVFLVLTFSYILIYFFSFMQQGHMGFAISESTHLDFPKNFFASLGIAWQSMEKVGFLGPTRAKTLAKKILLNQNDIYCNSVTLLPENI